jgi:hypothetical protein
MYRTNAIIKEANKRSKWKTIHWKFLLFLKGKWKDRFLRCQECKEIIDIYGNCINHIRLYNKLYLCLQKKD